MTDFEFENMIQFYEEQYKIFLDYNNITSDECSFDDFIAIITNEKDFY